MLRLALASLLLSTVCASAAEPWEGVWATDAAWCKNKSDQELLVRYSSKAITSKETDCKVTKVTRVQKTSAWIVDQACAGDGGTWDTRDILMVTDDGDLIRFTDDGFAITMTRCAK
jgi:hypothetical protein